ARPGHRRRDGPHHGCEHARHRSMPAGSRPCGSSGDAAAAAAPGRSAAAVAAGAPAASACGNDPAAWPSSICQIFAFMLNRTVRGAARMNV
ncbi:hypothetical protein QT22_00405, partial [Staphylococcus aureus]